MFRSALRLSAKSPARKHLSTLLVSQRRFDDALALWNELFDATPDDPEPHRETIRIALMAGRLAAASASAQRFAERFCATRFWPHRREHDPPARITTSLLKPPKLRHDIEQLTYLREAGVLAAEFDDVIEGYRRALERVGPGGDTEYSYLTIDERLTIGPLYNRIVHVARSSHVERALSSSWDRAATEDAYFENRPGIVAIDGLLSAEALGGAAALSASNRRSGRTCTMGTATSRRRSSRASRRRSSCKSPTSWRAAMPRMIGDLPLATMWAVKYDQEMSGIGTHADTAAVNVDLPDHARRRQPSTRAPRGSSYTTSRRHKSGS